MRAILTISFLLLAAVFPPCTSLMEGPNVVSIPPAEMLFQTLKKQHPRLLVHPESFDRLRMVIEKDDRVSEWYERLHNQGRELLDAPVSTYSIPDGLRLLRTSRTVLNRVFTLGLLYRLEEDSRYRQRLWREVEAAAEFPDWNPRHFLDTAEMSNALAIAYDWLYDSWSEEQKKVLRQALLTHGLRPAWEAYQGDAPHGWWTDVGHNWNQVCNGGIGIAALAIAEEEPDMASRVLYEALTRIPKAMVHYGPDGGWNEGPGYWHYATSYNVYLLAALKTALGTDFGLAMIDGFSKAGSFPIFMTGPTGKTFNYADGSDRTIRAPELFWLGARFQQPAYTHYQAEHARGSALDLLWYDPIRAGRKVEDLPLDAYYRGLEVVTMRDSWSDADAFFVGFKTGDNEANHSNLDVGSFILEALGERWIVDLGADDYNLPKYFDTGRRGARWTYYRMRAEGHNTVVINPGPGPDQDPFGKASIDHFESTPDRVTATSNLAPAYGTENHAVRRKVSLLRGNGEESTAAVVEDYIEMEDPSELWWFAHTLADIRLEKNGKSAILTRRGKKLGVEMTSSPDARFTVRDATPLRGSPDPAGQSANEGVRKLAIHFAGVKEARIRVVFRVP